MSAYVALVAMLRTWGKRTLSKMNAFDLVVTVALGSTLSSALLARDVPLAKGILAMAVLIGLQFAITWSCVRFRVVSRAVKSEPTLLVYRGRFLEERLEAERVTRGEIDAAARTFGYAQASAIHAVVLETDGSLSVIVQGELGDRLRAQAMRAGEGFVR